MEVKNTVGTLILSFEMDQGIVIELPRTIILTKTSIETLNLPTGTHEYDLKEIIGDSEETILFGMFTINKKI